MTTTSMPPTDAATALLDLLHLPPGTANVLVWHESSPPTLRVWVEARYLWEVKRAAPERFEGLVVEVEKRPRISAH